MVNPDRNLYDPPYDDALLYDNEIEPERQRGRPLIVLLGVVVLAAFAGVIWVAYNQGVKQGQRATSVPVLNAESSPTKIDGTQVAQVPASSPASDKSYERLWGDSNEPAGQETVLPAPEQPRAVPTAQDVAANTVKNPEVPTGSAGGPFEKKLVDPGLDPTINNAGAMAQGAPVAPAEPGINSPNLSQSVHSNGDPVNQGPSRSSQSPVEMVTRAPAVVAVAPAPASTPVKVAAPKAPVLPKAVAKPPVPVEAGPTPIVPSSEAPSIAEAAPESAPVEQPKPVTSGGKATIQLGSFPSDADAAAAWARVKSSNQSLLGAYDPQIVSAKIDGKGTWFRLRVGGFSDKSAAKDVCQQLQAAGQACILVGK
jgi:cell division septation protein DedD